jgi:mannose/fructose/N-acetylgalactosamine-specific phosphotransferase system component IID
MKKLLIGTLVGGLLVFGWQTLSWTMLNLHEAEYKQAPGQDAVISSLSNQLTEDGQYFIPQPNTGATAKEKEDFTKNLEGKPWAVVNFHKAYKVDMTTNIIRGLLTALIAVFLVCWILSKQNSTFATTFISCLLIGLVGYLFIPYSGHIWFETPGARTHLIDTFVAWGLCGIWLGWWLNRK